MGKGAVVERHELIGRWYEGGRGIPPRQPLPLIVVRYLTRVG